MSLTPYAARPLKLTCLSAHDLEDESLQESLVSHLSQLQRQGDIIIWSSQDISPGMDEENEVTSHIETADIILLLVSVKFLNFYEGSAYKDRVVARRARGNVRLIPVRLRPVDWDMTSFKMLTALPDHGPPIAGWSSRDDAFQNVVSGIKKVVKELAASVATKDAAPSFSALIPPLNPLFTGREALLRVLREKLTIVHDDGLPRPQAITGLDGIGKTQVAIKYIQLYGREYTTILWANAATHEVLISDFIKLARQFSVSILHEHEKDPAVVIANVRAWLEQHSDWLLVLDNANDRDVLRRVMPELPKHGHILLTTGMSTLGHLAESVYVGRMDPREGTIFLLRRAKLLTSGADLETISKDDRASAEILVGKLGGLPLALLQAGAYIDEHRCSVSEYLERYLSQGKILRNTPDTFWENDATTVATTWSLSFRAIEKENSAAAELLRVCAFLAPDNIPEEILKKGAPVLGEALGAVARDNLKLSDAIGLLRRYSLVERNPPQTGSVNGTLSMNGLVQDVLKDGMNDEVQWQWAERVVRAVSRAFPDGSIETWPDCQRCLPHAEVCADLIDLYAFTFPEAMQLLYHTALYLHSYGQYGAAEAYYQRALAIRRQQPEPGRPEIALGIAENCRNLARLYRDQYRYALAQPLFEEAIRLHEEQLGPEHPETAVSLRSFARLYQAQGYYDKAEELYLRAWTIHQRTLAPDHDDIISSTYSLARLYHVQGRYEKAKTLYEKVLEIDRQKFGLDHPVTAQCLNSLGGLYRDQLAYQHAEALILQALKLREKVLGHRHPDTAQSLNDLAGLYSIQRRYQEAEDLVQRALEIRQQVLRPRHPDIAQCLNNLGRLFFFRKQYNRAEQLYNQALDINRGTLGENHPYTAHCCSDLADLYFDKKDYEKAEMFVRRAFAIRVKLAGPRPSDVAQSLYSIARLYHACNRYELAELFYRYTLSVNEDALGPTDPRTITVRKNYASLLRTMNREEEAIALEARLDQNPDNPH